MAARCLRRQVRSETWRDDESADLILIECPLLTTVEACVAPGECVDVGGPSILEGIFADVMEMVSGFS